MASFKGLGRAFSTPFQTSLSVNVALGEKGSEGIESMENNSKDRRWITRKNI